MRDEMSPGEQPAAIVPRTFAEVMTMCQALAQAAIAPKHLRGNPVEMAMVVMTGLEVGLPPMASLRLYTTWDGVPRLMAEGVRAIILMRSATIEYFEMSTCSDTEATWIGKRRGRPEKSVTWTIERAKKANLLGKENWMKYPQDMLNARASMQLGRIIAPDVVAGMVALEEARDGDFIDANATETRPAFVAPAPIVAKPVADTPELRAAIAQIQAQPAAPLQSEPPRRGPGRPPKDPTPPVAASSSTPTSQKSPESSASSTSSDTSSPSASSSTPTSQKSPESSASSTSSDTSSPSSKLDAAIAKVEAKADPTPPDSNTGSMPAESVSASTGPTTSGAADAADGFGGDDPVDAPAPQQKLADFHAWLAECKTQRDLQTGLSKWRIWSQEQAKAGDKSFSKDGENTIAMQTAYGKRKGEVPA